jgi:methylmalonyl-CoA mutase, N-terminal domain
VGPVNARSLRRARRAKPETHAQTAGCSLTLLQNVVRTSLEALAAVLGGAQSLHTNSLDEAFALPSERAATLALRTQQAIACESGITAVPDPFGGSWFLESLTRGLEAGARDCIRAIDDMGGMIDAMKLGFPQAEIARQL